MQQIKIFKGVENDLVALENEVNAWLAKSQAVVKQVVGNIAPQSPASVSQGGHGLTKSEFPPSDILIMILYEKTG
jgi:hypothetical protein